MYYQQIKSKNEEAQDAEAYVLPGERRRQKAG